MNFEISSSRMEVTLSSHRGFDLKALLREILSWANFMQNISYLLFGIVLFDGIRGR